MDAELITAVVIGAGTLLLTSVLPIDSELIKWVSVASVSGGSAAVLQSGSALTRLTS
jgi:hypothetical protein